MRRLQAPHLADGTFDSLAVTTLNLDLKRWHANRLRQLSRLRLLGVAGLHAPVHGLSGLWRWNSLHGVALVVKLQGHYRCGIAAVGGGGH